MGLQSREKTISVVLIISHLFINEMIKVLNVQPQSYGVNNILARAVMVDKNDMLVIPNLNA